MALAPDTGRPRGGAVTPEELEAHSAELAGMATIRERLAGATGFPAGRALAEAIAPSPDPAVVAALQAETAEALALLQARVPGPAGAFDVRAAAGTAARGGVLELAELAEVLATVEVALEAIEAVGEAAALAPALAGALAALDAGALGRICSALLRALDRRGGLLDTASPELAAARRRLAGARRRAHEALRRLVATLRDHLTEGFTTERAGRPVLAVKASSRSAVPGLVHGASASGQTLFIEPMELVELSNRTRELAAAEAEEAERVLRALSALVGEQAPALTVAVETLARLDLALARARLSHSWGGCAVEVADEVELRRVRHPLLDPRTAVPIDLPLAGVRALVLSGPNTGGKTVALTTLALAALLHQCGLRPPAARARLPVFDRVLADIGDEQSIARSLSTFSAHVRTLQRILAAVGPRSLVLLDEVAGGTDPDEGTRLAQAVLEALVARGALVLATTHHPGLKAWASDAPRARNAAVDVDPETHAPRYTLRVGQPGASHALEIAERLGLPATLIAAARAAEAPERRNLAGLLAEAAAARVQAERERAEAVAQRERAATERGEEAMRAAEGERARERERGREQAARAAERRRAEAELAAAGRELAALRAEIAAARRAEAARAREMAGAGGTRARDRHLGAAADAAARARAALTPAARGGDAPPIRPGDRVVDPQMGFRGRVLGIARGEAEVQGEGVSAARLRLPVARLVAVREGREAGEGAGAPPGPPAAAVSLPPLRAAQPEIDVRGQRADAARAAVRERVDAASMAGLARVRVIHGKGTGALRAAVREELARHPLVERVEPSAPNEGGDGATIAVLDAG